jgi:hypothetical protein
MQKFRFLSRITILALVSIALSTQASSDGNNGEEGISGHNGSDGAHGKVGINWIPRDPNPEYFFYDPIKSGDTKKFQKVLASGANVIIANVAEKILFLYLVVVEFWFEDTTTDFYFICPER